VTADHDVERDDIVERLAEGEFADPTATLVAVPVLVPHTNGDELPVEVSGFQGLPAFVVEDVELVGRHLPLAHAHDPLLPRSAGAGGSIDLVVPVRQLDITGLGDDLAGYFEFSLEADLFSAFDTSESQGFGPFSGGGSGFVKSDLQTDAPCVEAVRI